MARGEIEKPFDWRDLLTRQRDYPKLILEPYYARAGSDQYVRRFEDMNGLVPTKPPLVPACKKCGAPCQKYGGIGGYSVCCKSCNEKNAERQRAARARKKPKS